MKAEKHNSILRFSVVFPVVPFSVVHLGFGACGRGVGLLAFCLESAGLCFCRLELACALLPDGRGLPRRSMEIFFLFFSTLEVNFLYTSLVFAYKVVYAGKV